MPVRRRGSAAVELAICLPILVLMGIVLAWMAYAGMVRLQIATQARNQAWRQRELAEVTEHPLDWRQSRQRPKLVARASTLYELRILAFPPLKAESTAMATPGTAWDHQSARFDDLSRLGVHRQIWNRLNSEAGPISPMSAEIVRDFLNAL